jgi:hypothetical protein
MVHNGRPNLRSTPYACPDNLTLLCRAATAWHPRSAPGGAARSDCGNGERAAADASAADRICVIASSELTGCWASCIWSSRGHARPPSQPFCTLIMRAVPTYRLGPPRWAANLELLHTRTACIIPWARASAALSTHVDPVRRRRRLAETQAKRGQARRRTASLAARLSPASPGHEAPASRPERRSSASRTRPLNDRSRVGQPVKQSVISRVTQRELRQQETYPPTVRIIP